MKFELVKRFLRPRSAAIHSDRPGASPRAAYPGRSRILIGHPIGASQRQTEPQGGCMAVHSVLGQTFGSTKRKASTPRRLGFTSIR